MSESGLFASSFLLARSMPELSSASAKSSDGCTKKLTKKMIVNDWFKQVNNYLCHLNETRYDLVIVIFIFSKIAISGQCWLSPCLPTVTVTASEFWSWAFSCQSSQVSEDWVFKLPPPFENFQTFFPILSPLFEHRGCTNLILYHFQESVQYFSSSTTINTNGIKLRKISFQKV